MVPAATSAAHHDHIKQEHLTVQALRSVFSCAGVCGAPHEGPSLCLSRHIPLRARSQTSSREASEGVRPGGRGAVDGAAIYPGGRRGDLHVFIIQFKGVEICVTM